MQLALRHVAVSMIILCLLIPVMGIAHAGVPDIGAAETRSIGALAGSPCDRCPCGDEQGSHCCDTDFCSCSFHSPPVQGVQVRYAPVVTVVRHDNPFRMLPQVYLSIFVPPQNRFPDRFPDLIENGYPLMPLPVV